MYISKLNLENFRIFKSVELNFHRQMNLIFGANGSGKTALIEALFYLGRGRSFRENLNSHIIQYGANYFRVIGEIVASQQKHLIGVERNRQDYKLHINGENASFSALAEILPIQIINSDLFALITGAPENRRKFTDYGLFYRNSDFFPLWRQYQYALKNRNAALRQNWNDEFIAPWNAQMAQAAEKIDVMRREWLLELEQTLNKYHEQFGALQQLSINYRRGWSEDCSLYEVLQRNLARDREQKFTRDGIHRAEWRLYADGHDCAHYFSRGQQKTAVCALIVAQSEKIAEYTATKPVILIDDLPAELDRGRRDLIRDFLQRNNCQLFISAIEKDEMNSDCAEFYLEQGQIVH
ncbi:MAG: DNA replication/repair protein RecF [Cardiobacteriaceae bacterium]|nr:DNA replication/repair protein RecF [Cardiobacteriaceae bacterium]